MIEKDVDQEIERLEERIKKLEKLLDKPDREISIVSDDKTLVIKSKNGLISEVKEK